jgi:LDH2 family malate/lactate/ureidoglycolate dehydrogenase
MTVQAAIEVESLRAFYVAAFEAMGTPRPDAETAAAGLLYADLRGFDTHGAANLDRIYLAKLASGEIAAAAAPSVVSERAAVAAVDGNRALGFVSGRYAMGLAIECAREYGVGAATVRNSTHCGSMGFYTQQAATAGTIGIALTNLGAQRLLPPLAGVTPLLGTNVVAAAAPSGELPNFSLDMSTATVSAGRLRAAQRRGEEVPAGWLVDRDGSDVLDPGAYFEGRAHLQFLGGEQQTGGHKGYGLAVLADLLCGVLAGARVGPERGIGDSENNGHNADLGIGHFFLALDVGAFRPFSAFAEGVDEMLSVLRESEPRQPDRPVSYPGLPEAETAAERLEQGVVPLERGVADSLAAVADRLSINPPKEVA